MLYGSHAKAVNRRRVRGACCAVCVWPVLRPRAQSTTTLFSLTARVYSKHRTAHRAPASACSSSPQNTRRCHCRCIGTLPRFLRRTLPAFGGLVWAWRCRTGHVVGEVRVQTLCGANNLPCSELFLRDLHGACLLLMRCGRFYRRSRFPLTNMIIVPLRT